MQSKIHTLKINKEFKSLIRPLQRREYLQLEKNIIEEGCREPITIWNGVIIDGHNRYEICRKHNIPFEIRKVHFDSKEAAIVWICSNQLGRRNITEETRRFLIGLQYETEKLISGRKRGDLTRQSEPEDDFSPDEPMHPNRHVTAERLAKENNVSFGTVQKYARYTRALEAIGKKAPDLVPKILSGKYKISHNNILEIENMPPAEIQELTQSLERKSQPYIKFKGTRSIIHGNADKQGTPMSVKDMPTFDPDASITELTLTIPSWLGSVKRTKTNTNFDIVSKPAKRKFIAVLTEFETAIHEMLMLIKEDD